MRKMVVWRTKIIFWTSSDVCQSFNIQEYFKDVTFVSDDEELSNLTHLYITCDAYPISYLANHF